MLIGGEPTSVIPDEMENLAKELPRDPETVALLKRISDECIVLSSQYGLRQRLLF
jgi:hypothetical protein